MNTRIHRERMVRCSDGELREIVTTQAHAHSDNEMSAAWRELRLRGIADVPNANTRGQAGASELPTRWLTFYAWWTPIAEALRLKRLLTAGAFTSAAATFLLLVVPACVLWYGLRRRRLWGYRLNLVVLGYELVAGVLYSVERLHSPRGAAMVLLIMLLWVVPNYVYFKKRADLFS
jgi:hypothetical protein